MCGRQHRKQDIKCVTKHTNTMTILTVRKHPQEGNSTSSNRIGRRLAILAFPSDFDIIMTIILVGLTSSKAENRAELTNTYEHNDDFGDGAELSASGLLGVIKPDWLTVDWL
jgi:hypothetical protein